MGCDIHAMVERKTRDGWEFVAAVHIPRWYRLFGAMAGVRDSDVTPVARPRGLPTDMGLYSEHRFEDIAGDHTPSWLSTEEFAEAARRASESDDFNPSLVGIIAMMRAYEEARIVFNFDS